MVEVSELLERIKDGNISKYIKEVYEVEEMGLRENKKKVLFKVIDFNRKGKFPTVLDLCESYPQVTLNHLNYLKEKELVLGFTIIELVMFFGNYKNFKLFYLFHLIMRLILN
ncbi:MAG: hypothetical protein QW403_01455 [Candidatus Aenigmatarchaeota archaeon]